MGPALVAPYLPKSISGQGERIEGEVLRKQQSSRGVVGGRDCDMFLEEEARASI
jgi:hypothetical protein